MNYFSENDPNLYSRLDFQALQNGWVSKYLDPDFLSDDLKWFEKEGYKVVVFECAEWVDEKTMHKKLKYQLNFPDYYGENSAALRDCLCDMPILTNGTVLVFKDFDKMDIELGSFLLNVMADAARIHLLFGRRLILLSKVSNPKFIMASVGACAVSWNNHEWNNKDRGL